MKKVIEYITIETFIHATESTEKVLMALENLGIPGKSATLEEMSGYHGNVIIVVRYLLKRQQEKNAFLRSPFIMSLREDILETLDSRVDDKGQLYIRADKQDLFENNYSIKDRGDVKMAIKVLAYPMKREKVIENAKKLFCS